MEHKLSQEEVERTTVIAEALLAKIRPLVIGHERKPWSCCCGTYSHSAAVAFDVERGGVRYPDQVADPVLWTARYRDADGGEYSTGISEIIGRRAVVEMFCEAFRDHRELWPLWIQEEKAVMDCGLETDQAWLELEKLRGIIHSEWAVMPGITCSPEALAEALSVSRGDLGGTYETRTAPSGEVEARFCPACPDCGQAGAPCYPDCGVGGNVGPYRPTAG